MYLREGMTVEEFLASACGRKNLNAMEHFVRVKKRRDMEDHNYFVPHRNDPIETYVSPQLAALSPSHSLGVPSTCDRDSAAAVKGSCHVERLD